jgi:signal transduction protein with GAF and PtsI domain
MAKKKMDYFTAIYNVAKVVNGTLDTSHVLSTIVRCVTETMKVKACSLRLLDTRGQRLMLGAYYGLSEKYLHKGPVLVKESGLDRKSLKGQTMYVRNAQTDRNFQYRDMARREGIISVLVVPLRVGDNVIGVMRVYSGTEREFDEKEVKFLEAVANLSAIAIDNARLYQALRKNFELVIENRYRLDDL